MGEGKRLKELEQLAVRVNALEPETEVLTDAELAAKTDEFRERYTAGESLDEMEAEAFAVVREAARRTLGQRHFDVQVVGAGALHRGDIAEMKTGEGKTLVSTMPSYLNAWRGGGVHMVTVNDYLAKRDCRVDGADPSLPRVSRSGLIQAEMSLPNGRPPTPPTSPTAPTTSSASTTSATTWRCVTPETWSSAATRFRDRGRGRFDPHRRGTHAADHQRSGSARPASGTASSPAHRATAARARRSLRGRREEAPGRHDRRGCGTTVGADPRRRQHVRPRQRRPDPPPRRCAQGEGRSISGRRLSHPRTAR